MSEAQSSGAVPAAIADTVEALTRSVGPVKVIGVLGMLGGIALVVVGLADAPVVVKRSSAVAV
jgi:hypothetical protein